MPLWEAKTCLGYLKAIRFAWMSHFPLCTMIRHWKRSAGIPAMGKHSAGTSSTLSFFHDIKHLVALPTLCLSSCCDTYVYHQVCHCTHWKRILKQSCKQHCSSCPTFQQHYYLFLAKATWRCSCIGTRSGILLIHVVTCEGMIHHLLPCSLLQAPFVDPFWAIMVLVSWLDTALFIQKQLILVYRVCRSGKVTHCIRHTRTSDDWDSACL